MNECIKVLKIAKEQLVDIMNTIEDINDQDEPYYYPFKDYLEIFTTINLINECLGEVDNEI